MKTTITLIALLCSNICFCQNLVLKGKIEDKYKESIPFANIALYQANDTISIVKGTASDLAGKYLLQDIDSGNYILKVSYIGSLLSGENSLKQLLLTNNQLVTRLIKFFD